MACRLAEPGQPGPPLETGDLHNMTPLTLACLLYLDGPSRPAGDTTRALWLADLHPDRVQASTPDRFVIVPDSLPEEVDGHVLVEAIPFSVRWRLEPFSSFSASVVTPRTWKSAG